MGPNQVWHASRMGILVEVCCATVAEAVAAESAGADRIELCSALPVGGVTPSVGAFLECRDRLHIPIAVFVRPAEGGFDPAPEDFQAMLRDVAWFASNGACHIVAGTTDSDGMPDARNKEIVSAAGGLSVAYHRAFDTAPDQSVALDVLVGFGFTRMLTSGGPGRAADHLPKLRGLIGEAPSSFTVTVGGTVRAGNVVQIVQNTGCREVHLASRTLAAGSYSGHQTPVPSSEAAEVVSQLRIAGLRPAD